MTRGPKYPVFALTMTDSTVRERPIMFSGPMVRAILAGRKTQTRRVIRPQPTNDLTSGRHPVELFDGAWSFLTQQMRISSTTDAYGQIKWTCPYGVSGDRLWVRETWCAGDKWMGCSCDPPCTIRYRADGYVRTFTDPSEWFNPDTTYWSDPKAWRPSIYMPRWASRIRLEVTEVRRSNRLWKSDK